MDRACLVCVRRNGVYWIILNIFPFSVRVDQHFVFWTDDIQQKCHEFQVVLSGRQMETRFEIGAALIINS